MATVQQAKDQLRRLVQLEMNNIVFGVEGPAGIGKSAIFKQVTKEFNIGYVDWRLAQMADAADVTGIPWRDANGVMKYSYPPTWPREGKGLFVLEEPNRAPMDIRQAVFQLFTDRCIGEHVLPPGWIICLAFNPSEGDISYDVAATDPAWNSRFVKLSVSASVEDWLKWAAENGINELVRRFIGANQKLMSVPRESAAFPCPRTWEMVSNLMNKDAVLPELQGDVFNAIVGMEAAAAFIKFIDKEYIKPMSGKEVLEGKNITSTISKQRTDENNATIVDVLSLLPSTQIKPPVLKCLLEFTFALQEEQALSFLVKLNNKTIQLMYEQDNKLLAYLQKMHQGVVNG